MHSKFLKFNIILMPALWLFAFIALPIFFLFKISISESILAKPPFADIFNFDPDGGFSFTPDFYAYQTIFEDVYYLDALTQSMALAFIATFCCFVLAFFMGWAMIQYSEKVQNILLILVILPFWTSFLIRIYSWKILLRNDGLINNALISLGIIDAPIPMLYSDFAVFIGITYSYLPFMILPIYSGLKRIDKSILDAAIDLGTSKLRIIFRIILPMIMPSIIAGSILVFIPATGEYVIPDLLGGSDTLLIGKVIWIEFLNNRDWPMASALSILLLLIFLLPFLYIRFSKNSKKIMGMMT